MFACRLEYWRERASASQMCLPCRPRSLPVGRPLRQPGNCVFWSVEAGPDVRAARKSTRRAGQAVGECVRWFCVEVAKSAPGGVRWHARRCPSGEVRVGVDDVLRRAGERGVHWTSRLSSRAAPPPGMGHSHPKCAHGAAAMAHAASHDCNFLICSVSHVTRHPLHSILSAVILHTNYAGGHYTAFTRPSGQGIWHWCDGLHVVRGGSIWLEFPDRKRTVQGRPVLIVHTSGDPLPSPPSLAPEAAQIAAASSTLQPAKQPANPPHPQNTAKATNPHAGRNPTTVPPFPSLVTLPPPPLSGSARWLNTHQTPARTLNDELVSPTELAKRIAVLAAMIHSVGKEVGHSARRAAGKW